MRKRHNGRLAHSFSVNRGKIASFPKAKEKLGWRPSVKFPELVKMMAGADLKRLKN